MNQELEILESFILKKINPAVVSGFSSKLFEEFQTKIVNEKSHIKESILKTVFGLNKDQHIRIYVYDLQNKLILLADALYCYLKNEDPLLDNSYKKPCLHSIQKEIYFYILDLLSFLKRNFQEFINPDEKIPDGVKFIAIQNLKYKLTPKKKINNCVYNELISVTFTPLNQFFENHIPITSEELKYFEKLVAVCSEMNFMKVKDPVITLLKKLIFINFNSAAFFDFITDQIKLSINSIKSTPDKLEKLSLYLKKVNQAPVDTELWYNRKSRSIKDMLSQWIVEEIIFYEKISKNREEISPHKEMDFKITTSFSVSQLACFLKILVETGIISNQNDMDIIRFFATVTQSKRTESISFNSLRSKYYNIEDSTRQEVKDYVLKMLNNIHQQTNIIFLSVIFLIPQL